MGYVNDNLMPNEKVLFTAKVHPAIFLPSIISLIMSIAILIYGLRNPAITSQPVTATPEVNSSNVSIVFLMFLCMVGFLLVYSFSLGIRALITISTTEFGITNRRVIAKKGFIRRHTLELLLSKVESVSVNQNVLGRLLNFGTVTITGTGGTKESFHAIVDPIEVRKKIHQIIEGYNRYLQKQSTKPISY